jgi:hypothetical protein
VFRKSSGGGTSRLRRRSNFSQRQCFGEAEIHGHVICLVTFAWRARFGVGSRLAEFDFKTLYRYLEADQSQSKAYCVAYSIEVNSVLGGATVDKCWPKLRDVSRTERFNSDKQPSHSQVDVTILASAFIEHKTACETKDRGRSKEATQGIN